MKHLSILFLLILRCLICSGQTFPYFNSLSAPSSQIALFGNADNTNAGYPGYYNSFLYLTPAVNSRSGFALFNDASFPSNGGMHIEFEFSANPSTGNGADGFSMFLFDANSNITISNSGASGGAFGYANIGSNQGLENAYLGIGFDEYGNFKAYEQNKNGFPKTSTFLGGNNDNSFRNHVTIRGAAGKNYATLNPSTGKTYNDYYWGYPVLYTSSTQRSGLARYTGYLKTDAVSQTAGTSSSTSMVPGNGNNVLYGYSTSPVSTSSYTLGTSSLAADTTSNDFRKAIIDITPVFSSGTTVSGYNITVRVKHGTITETMVNSFFYPIGTLKYVDNRDDTSSAGTGVVTNINTTPPTSFGLGFASSTGGNNNNHVIRNLFISIPIAAVSNDDYASICLNANSTTIGSTTISPLDNDQAYNNAQSTPNSSNIEPSSFRFNSDAATLLDSSSSSSAYQTITKPNGVMSSVTTTNASGVWTYTTSTKQLTYKRAANYKGVAKVLYSITSSYTGLNNNTYRSKAATVSVGLTGPRVTRDSAYTNLYPGIGSATGSQNVIKNDTSFTYVSGSSALTTSGASAINTSSFYFSSGDGLTNLGNTSMSDTYGSWTFSNNTVSLTPSNSFSGIATAYYRISTADGCLSDVDTVVFNYPYSLPVKYTQELTAYLATSNSIILNWTTGSEINNSHFTILRSSNSTDWDSIGVVKSKFINGNGAGTSYSFTDNLFSSSINYYRLKQVDLDGTISLGNIVSVQVSNLQQRLKLFPNPTKGTINIQNAKIGASYRIISLDGKLITSGIVRNQTQSVDITNVSSGVYFCEIIDISNQKHLLKFIKE